MPTLYIHPLVKSLPFVYFKPQKVPLSGGASQYRPLSGVASPGGGGAETPPATQTNPLCLVHRYKEGMLRARQGDPKTEQVVQSVAEGMLTITDTRGQDAVEDWEVDELLEWTNGLNFDQYVKTLFCRDFWFVRRVW